MFGKSNLSKLINVFRLPRTMSMKEIFQICNVNILQAQQFIVSQCRHLHDSCADWAPLQMADVYLSV